MKIKAWFLPVVALLSAGAVLAQETNMVPPADLSSTSAVPPAVTAPVVPEAPAPSLSVPAPAPATIEAAPANEAASAPNAPAKHKIVRKIKKAAPHILTHNLLDPSVEATVKVQNLNVRAQPSVNGDLIAKLHQGETVTVLEDLTIKGKKNEATNWARIVLPANTPVWVSAHLISSNKTVISPRINVRSGPGENFAIVGHLEKGAVVKDLRNHKDWMKIEAPADASAFVSADYLEKSAAAPAAAAPEVASPAPSAQEPSPTSPAPEAAPLPAPSTEVVNVPPDTNGNVMPAAEEPAPAQASAPETAEAPAPAVAAPTVELPKDEILPKRIVNREGFLSKSLNIQAPSDYELRDVRTGELLDYVAPLKPDLDLKPFVGSKVIVSGEEAVDARWKFIPLIKVETIDVL